MTKSISVKKISLLFSNLLSFCTIIEIHRGILIVLLASSTQFLVACKFQPGWGYNRNFTPQQPLPFDHSLHAGKKEGQFQIACKYCHNQVDRSSFSNIPALNTCMNCHLLVKGDSPYIQKLQKAFNSGQSIPWVKVHMLPDHVKFDHSAHDAKGINCATCHGPVEDMKSIYQFSDLSMGWCVNCHRESQNNAPTNCSTCHN